jgi:hypothetical protein
MSGLFDLPDWIPGNRNVCLDEANAKVAGLDAKTQDLARTWMPNGFYTPAELQHLLVSTMELANSAMNALSEAPTSTSDASSQIQQAVTKLGQQGQRSMVYVEALRKATASGATVLNAAGLKTWVLDTMQAVSSALVTAAVMECNMPWLASAIIMFQSMFDALASVAKRIVGVVVNVGDTVLDVADNIGNIVTILKWAAILGGGAYLAIKLGEVRRSGGG